MTVAGLLPILIIKKMLSGNEVSEFFYLTSNLNLASTFGKRISAGIMCETREQVFSKKRFFFLTEVESLKNRSSVLFTELSEHII